MIRKIILLSWCFAMLTISAYASHFIRTDTTVITVPVSADQSVHADFYEGKKLVRFAAGRLYGQNVVRLMCLQKGKWYKPDKLWWSMDEPFPRYDSYSAFRIDQYEDLESKRYFYGVECFFAMDAAYRAYLLGFDKDGKKMNEYINTDNFSENEGKNLLNIHDKDGTLYLFLGELGLGGVNYKLNWSEKDQWFGYEYLGKVH